MTKRRLFFTRLKRDWKTQAKAWASALDWTVWLYLLIPALIIGGGMYLELWETLPAWSEAMPWLLFAKISLFIMILLARIRVYLEAADRLFMLQKPAWVQALRRYGMMYGGLKQAAALLLPLVLLLPFLLKAEQLSRSTLMLYYLHAWSFSMIAAAAEHVTANVLLGWRKWAVYLSCVSVIAVFYFVSAGWLSSSPAVTLILTLFAAFISLMAALRAKLNIEQEVEREQSAKLKTTELLMSQVIESKPKINLRKPFLWTKSQRIFKTSDAGTILAEMRLKAYARKLSHLQVWLGFISISSVALTLVPPAAAAALIIALAAMGANWLRAQWLQWIAEEFIAQYSWTDRQKNDGIVLSRGLIMLPAIAVWCAVVGFLLGGVWLSVSSFTLGGVIWLFISWQLLKSYK